jgi:hypothetical protein
MVTKDTNCVMSDPESSPGQALIRRPVFFWIPAFAEHAPAKAGE